MTWKLHRKAWRNTDHNHQKQYWCHKDQQNGNNQKTKREEKQLNGSFKQLTRDISHKKMWMWLRKGNFKRETESLLTAAQNNAIRTNHIKVTIDKMQQNSRCRLCGDRGGTINYIIGECSKLAKKCIKLDMTGWIRWFTGNWARNLNLTIQRNSICTTQHLSRKMRCTNSTEILKYKRITKKIVNRLVNFAVSADHRFKMKESKKKDNYLDFAREWKKLWNMKVTILPIVICTLGTVTKGLVKGMEDLEIKKWVETIQTTALLRSVRILRKSWILEETCHSNSSERPSANADVKNTQAVKIICPNGNPSLRMRCTKFSGILRDKQIT